MAVASVFVLLLAAAEHGEAAKRCGQASATNAYGGNAVLAIEAKRMGCGKAKSVVRRAWRSGLMNPGQRREIGRFSCTYVGYYEPGTTAIRCNDGRRAAKGLWTPEVSAGRDLASGAPELEVVCATEYGDPGRVAYRTRPHECMFHKRFTPVASAYMVKMRGIRWTHWGPKVAVGKGKFLANMAGPTPGRVRLTHPVEVCGHRVFTIAHFKFQGLPSSGQGLPLDRRVGTCR
jgi:hypothetical protein